MGWAKYHEDNQEIMYERYAAMQARAQEMEMKIVCASSLPVVKLVVELNTTEPISYVKEANTDQYIMCKECGQKFIFTVNAQKHYKVMGWNAPKRCKLCREHRNTRCLMRPAF